MCLLTSYSTKTFGKLKLLTLVYHNLKITPTTNCIIFITTIYVKLQFSLMSKAIYSAAIFYYVHK